VLAVPRWPISTNRSYTRVLRLLRRVQHVRSVAPQDKIEELTHLFLTNVYRYHPFARGNEHDAPLTDVSIELCPEEGPGAYAVSYEVIEEAQRRDAPCLDLGDVATIRSAFMHRYEWVINELHSVEEDRSGAWETSETGYPTVPVVPDYVGNNEVPLSEEEDHYALQPDIYCKLSVSAHLLRWPGLSLYPAD